MADSPLSKFGGISIMVFYLFHPALQLARFDSISGVERRGNKFFGLKTTVLSTEINFERFAKATTVFEAFIFSHFF